MENRTQVTQFILLRLRNAPELQIPFFILFMLIYLITVLGKLGMILTFMVTFNVFLALLVILIFYLFTFITIIKRQSAKGYKKAVSICVFHHTAVCIFYGTILFMYLQPSSSHSMDIDKMASVFYTMIVPILNPLVYSLRNKDDNSAFKKVAEKAKVSLCLNF